EARREPVEITRNGRRELVLMSADHYDWLIAAARRTHQTTNAVQVVVDAVRSPPVTMGGLRAAHPVHARPRAHKDPFAAQTQGGHGEIGLTSPPCRALPTVGPCFSYV